MGKVETVGTTGRDRFQVCPGEFARGFANRPTVLGRSLHRRNQGRSSQFQPGESAERGEFGHSIPTRRRRAHAGDVGDGADWWRKSIACQVHRDE